MNTHNLLEKHPRQLFYQYLIPSVLGALVTSIYLLADTIIIGQGVGSLGLSALNLILPVFTVFTATGVLFGVGGGVHLSMANGSGDKDKANQYGMTALTAGILLSLIFCIIGTLFFDTITALLGVNDINRTLVNEYARIIFACSPLFVLSNLFQGIIRNGQNPKLVMIGVLTGSILNIVLDYIFVFPMNMGMFGAALATVIGTLTTVLILISHFFTKRSSISFSIKDICPLRLKMITMTGLAGSLMELSNGIVILLFNYQLLRYLGNDGVIIYGIIANYSLIVLAIFNGIGQAAQPIVASNHGAGLTERVQIVKKLGLSWVTTVGIFVFLVGILFPQFLICLFIKPTTPILVAGCQAIRIYFLSFLAAGINLFLIQIYQATGKEDHAFRYALYRGMIINSILILSLPLFFGGNGLWLVMPLTESLILLLLMVKNRKTNCVPDAELI